MVDEPVIGRDAGKAGRIPGRHQPLCHGVVGLADAADAAIAPGLPRDPPDQLDIVLLLVAIHEGEFAFGTPRAAHVGVHIGIALLHVPFDRSGLAPEKQREGRHAVELVLVGRGREQRRHTAVALWPIDAERDPHSVPHRDLDVAFDPHSLRVLVPWLLLRHVLVARRLLLHCDETGCTKRNVGEEAP